MVHFVTSPAPPLITFNPAPASLSHPHEGVEVGSELFVPDLVSSYFFFLWEGTYKSLLPFHYRVQIRFGVSTEHPPEIGILPALSPNPPEAGLGI